jgi:hypothetical protein
MKKIALKDKKIEINGKFNNICSADKKNKTNHYRVFI